MGAVPSNCQIGCSFDSRAAGSQFEMVIDKNHHPNIQSVRSECDSAGKGSPVQSMAQTQGATFTRREHDYSDSSCDTPESSKCENIISSMEMAIPRLQVEQNEITSTVIRDRKNRFIADWENEVRQTILRIQQEEEQLKALQESQYDSLQLAVIPNPPSIKQKIEDKIKSGVIVQRYSTKRSHEPDVGSLQATKQSQVMDKLISNYYISGTTGRKQQRKGILKCRSLYTNPRSQSNKTTKQGSSCKRVHFSPDTNLDFEQRFDQASKRWWQIK